MAIWFLGYFPNHDAYDTVKEQQEHSFIGYIGKTIEPVLEPLGFDWRMGVGIIAGVGAKELVVSTLGVMYADDQPVNTESYIPPVVPDTVLPDTSSVTSTSPSVTSSPSSVTSSEVEKSVDSDQVAETRLQKALVNSVTPAGALAYMVFILLYFPCIATFIAIKNEGGGWKWAIITAVYTIILAWIAAFITFNLASLFL
jgi:ferrous iron transport protein B